MADNKALDQTLEAIRNTRDADELATLLLMATLIYAENQSVCEGKANTYGNGTAEVAACEWDMNRGRDKMHKTFQLVAGRMK